MKLMIRYLSLSVLMAFSLPAIPELHAQNFEETINFADSQFKSGDFTTALKAYQRALFFSEGRNNEYLFRQIAELSYFKKDYETAQKYYGFALNQSDNDSLRTELLFSKAFCQILNKNYQLALIDLFSIDDTSLIIKSRLNFYLATCYFGLADFSQARTFFKLCIPLKDTAELGCLFAKRNILTPSPKKARILSTILPGSGQIYSGDLKAGLNSLLLTSGLIAVGINISLRYRPVDAVFSILPWYQRYYIGGYGKAEEIALRKRELKRKEVYNKILRLISENATQY